MPSLAVKTQSIDYCCQLIEPSFGCRKCESTHASQFQSISKSSKHVPVHARHSLMRSFHSVFGFFTIWLCGTHGSFNLRSTVRGHRHRRCNKKYREREPCLERGWNSHHGDRFQFNVAHFLRRMVACEHA